MQVGASISAALHLGILALAAFGGMRSDPEVVPLPATASDVTIVSFEAFDAVRSKAPSAPDETAASLVVPQLSNEASEAPLRPIPDTAPEREAAVTMVAPAATDTPPDVSALQRPAPSVDPAVTIAPEAGLVAPQLDAPLGFDSALPDAPVRDGSLNSSNLTALEAPKPQRAPRIDTQAAPAPPKPVKEAPQVQEAAVAVPEPEPEPEPQPEPTPETAAAPPESTTEIQPDAQAQDSPAAPLTASMPRGRPARASRAAEAQEEELAKSQEARIIAALRAANSAKEAAMPQTLDEAPDPDAPEPETGTRLGQGFSFSQSAAVAAAISKKWNKGSITGKANYERLVVVLRVRLRADGSLMGRVEPIEPANPTGDFKIAFETARRAVLGAMPLPLPQETFRDGDYLELRFDPSAQAPSLN